MIGNTGLIELSDCLLQELVRVGFFVLRPELIRCKAFFQEPVDAFQVIVMGVRVENNIDMPVTQFAQRVPEIIAPLFRSAVDQH